MKKAKFVASLVVAAVLTLGLVTPAAAHGVDPPEVTGELRPGESMTLTKEVTTPEIPPVVDICLLEDETGSFWDDIANLQGGATASDIYDAIVAVSPNAQFAVAGFRDYPIPPYGWPGDWVYRLLSDMSPAKQNWLAGIAALTAGGGNDTPEAQYDAIVAATTGVSWRDGVQRVLVVTTDAPFHLPGPGKPHVNTQVSTIAALQAQNIIVIGLKAPGSAGELNALAAATGGSVQPLSPSGENIAEAILAGLEEITTDVWWEVKVDPGLNVELSPAVYYDVPGATTVDFEEKISLDEDAPQCHTLEATVTFYANSYPEEGEVIGTETIRIHVRDITAPKVWCEEAENPHGKNIPPAGRTTLPGPKGGKNEDGFYRLRAEDNCTPQEVIAIYVGLIEIDPETGELIPIWAPGWDPTNPEVPPTIVFQDGDIIKVTEAPGAAPSCKKIGSTNGQAGAVMYHITVPTELDIVAVDASGNPAFVLDACLVPPPPK